MIKSFLFLFIYLASSIGFGAIPTTQMIIGKALLTGESVTVSSAGKRGLVVVFLSARCPCSNSHITEIKELSEKFKKFQFVVLHSNADESQEEAKVYFKNSGFSFPVIGDVKTKYADQLQALKTPHAYIFSEKGDVLYQGGVSNSSDLSKSDRKYLREALEDVDQNKSVRTPQGRTLGCSIARG